MLARTILVNFGDLCRLLLGKRFYDRGVAAANPEIAMGVNLFAMRASIL
jgi:hypothetical protein